MNYATLYILLTSHTLETRKKHLLMIRRHMETLTVCGIWTCITAINPAPISHSHTIPNVLPWIHSWTNIQNCKLVTSRLNWTTIIVINNVPNFFSTAINYPVMTIKWKLISVKKKKKITSIPSLLPNYMPKFPKMWICHLVTVFTHETPFSSS